MDHNSPAGREEAQQHERDSDHQSQFPSGAPVMATAYFATADEDVVQGKKGKKKELKEVCMFLVIPQSTPLPESDS